MKLDTTRFGLAFGGTAALLWVICSALVALLPAPMLSMTGHMLHVDTAGFDWTLTWTGFFLGLISWVVWSLLAGWLVGWLYNRLQRAASS